ncbi:hypothetical protein F4810DRAFT_644783, partial [Camillea tinctor]
MLVVPFFPLFFFLFLVLFFSLSIIVTFTYLEHYILFEKVKKVKKKVTYEFMLLVVACIGYSDADRL